MHRTDKGANSLCPKEDNILSSLYEYACDSGRVAFVQQLLDEDGGVPADPATAQVIQEERLRAMAQKAASWT